MKNRFVGTAIAALMPFTSYALAKPAAYSSSAYRNAGSVIGKDYSKSIKAVSENAQKADKSLDTFSEEKLGLQQLSVVSELVVIDASVPDKHLFYSQLKPGQQAIEIEAGSNGLDQLLNALEAHQNLDGLFIISHAESGTVQLGNGSVDQRLLESDKRFFDAINQSLKPGADVHFYGCDLAAGVKGEEFLDIIQANTHVDLAASNDLTGNAEQGGDWDLEIQRGDIDSDRQFSALALKDFSDVLAIIVGGGGISNSGAYEGASTINAVYNHSGSLFTFDGADVSTQISTGYVYVGGAATPLYESALTLSIDAGTFDVSSFYFAGDTNVQLSFTSDQGDSQSYTTVSGVETINLTGFTGISTLAITFVSHPSFPGMVAQLKDFNVSNIDATPPVFSAVSPSSSSNVANANVGYTLSEALASGTVTFTRTAGTADGSSPHVATLTGAELNSGTRASAALTNAPTLVSGATYTISFDGQDAAANTATTVSSTSVSFDNTAPVFTGISPTTSSSISSADVGYTLSEALASGTVTFTRTGGTADGSSPHVVNLAGAELNAGTRASAALTNAPTLVDGTIYTISFDGTDAAGNSATTVSSTSVTYSIPTSATTTAASFNTTTGANLSPSFSFGAADETLTIGAATHMTGSTADGGGGTDILNVNAGEDLTALSSLANFETLNINDGFNYTMTGAQHASFTTINAPGVGNTAQIQLAATGGTSSVTGATGVDGYILNDAYTFLLADAGQAVTGNAGANQTINVSILTPTRTLDGGSGGSDTLQMANGANISSATVSNFETLSIDSGSAVTMTEAQHESFGSVTAPGIQQINLSSSDGDGSITGDANVENYLLDDVYAFTLGDAGQGVTGNAGANQTINVGTLTPTGTLDGGAGGTDILQLGNGANIAAATVSNFETLQLPTADSSVTADPAQFNGFTTVNASGGGTNTISLNASATLTDKTLTNIQLSTVSGGSETITLSASTANNVFLIAADSANDSFIVTGSAGDQSLVGSAGVDSLSGGAGSDNFHFVGVSNLNGDTITDLSLGEQITLIANTGGVTTSAVRFGASNDTLEIDLGGIDFSSIEATVNLSNTPGASLSPSIDGVDIGGGNVYFTMNFSAPTVMLPISTDFSAYPDGWDQGQGATTPSGSTSSWAGGSLGVDSVAKVNLFSNTRNEWLISPYFVATATTNFDYKVAVTGFNSTFPSDMGSDDSVDVMVSTDFGVTWSSLKQYTNADGLSNTLTDQSVSLAAYDGQTIQVAFFATEGSVNDAEDLDFHVTDIFIGELLPTITSATYDASTGNLVVTGTDFSANGGGSDVDASTFTITGEGGNSYTLTDTADVEITSATAFTLSLSATDKLNVNGLLNANGTSSDGSTTYNLAAADDFITAVTSGDTSDTSGNGITVSNVFAPTITSATFDATTYTLVVTGTGFVKSPGASNDIDVSKITVSGETYVADSFFPTVTYTSPYTVLSTSDVEISSETQFTVSLTEAAFSGVLTKNGTQADGGATYNLAFADDWMPGAATSTNIADLTGNGLTVSNAFTYVISSTSNVTTNGGNDGSATGTAAGGAPVINYQWSNGATNASAINLAAGTYNTRATDSNGLVRDRSVTITEPLASPVVTTPSSAVSVNAATQTIGGTHSQNGVTVHAYLDANNDGVADNTSSLGNSTVASNAWSFSVSLTTDTANNFVVRADAGGGNISSDVDVPTVTEDSTTPTFNSASSNPLDNAAGIAAGSNIVLNFSENIELVNGNTVTLVDVTNSATRETFTATSASAGTGSSSGTMSVSTNTLTLNPGVDLQVGTQYAVQIAAATIDDIAGNSFAGIADNTIYNFMTAPELSISANPATILEAGGVATFTVALRDGAGNLFNATENVGITVNLSTASATLTSDYTLSGFTGTSDTVTIATGNSSASFTATGVDDAPTSDPGETLTATLAAAPSTGTASVSTTSNSAMVTIQENAAGVLSISGEAVIGATLTANLSDADGLPGSITYQWMSDGSNVGSNQTTYVVQSSDEGNTITVNAQYTDNNSGAENVTSSATPAVVSVVDNALNLISSIAGGSSGSPTSQMYSDAGVTGVTDGNVLTLANNAVRTTPSSNDVNETSELQTIVDAILEGQDDDGDGLPNIFEGSDSVDTDGDGTADRDDTDSDNDGIVDAVENNLTLTDSDNDGIIDVLDADDGNDAVVDAGKMDTNLDGVIDDFDTLAKVMTFLNNDQDGDTIPDTADADVDGDGSIDVGLTDVSPVDGIVDGQEGFVALVQPFFVMDFDNDGLVNFLDLDSDSDSLADVIEAGFTDSDENALLDAGDTAIDDVNNLTNTDADAQPNYLDVISDGSSNDILTGSFSGEAGTLDANSDGTLDDLTDDDSDGIANVVDNLNGFGRQSSTADSDGDGVPDNLDIRVGTSPDVTTPSQGVGSFSAPWLMLLGLMTLVGAFYTRRQYQVRSLLVLAALPLVLMASPGAEASDTAKKWELGIGVGQSTHDPDLADSLSVDDENDTALRASVAYLINDIWAAQLRYTELGTIDVLGNSNSAPIDSSAVELNARYRLPWLTNSAWYPYVLAGASQVSSDADAVNLEDDSGTYLQLGAGINRDFNSWSAGLEYTSYNSDLSAVVVSVYKRFGKSKMNETSSFTEEPAPVEEIADAAEETQEAEEVDADDEQVAEAEDLVEESLEPVSEPVSELATNSEVSAETIALIQSKTVYFDQNSSILSRSERKNLDNFAELLLANPKLSLKVEAHSDSVGEEKYNLFISERRAKRVKDYLAAKGVPAEQLDTRGIGEGFPVASNDTDEGRAMNRRVEFVISE